MVFLMILAFLIFDPKRAFCTGVPLTWAIAFARWAICNIVWFLESYLVFLRAAFFTEQLQCSSRMVFCMFLAFLIFDPSRPFCKGYSLLEAHGNNNLLKENQFTVYKSARISVIVWYLKCSSSRFLSPILNTQTDSIRAKLFV